MGIVKKFLSGYDERLQFARRNGGLSLLKKDLNWLRQWWKALTAEQKRAYLIVTFFAFVGVFICVAIVAERDNSQGKDATTQTKAAPVTFNQKDTAQRKLVEEDTGYNKKWEQHDAQLIEKVAQLKEQSEKFEQNCLSPWDGSCIPVTEYVKEHMNDPGSFEHVETSCANKGDYFLVMMSYRGKNAYGGIVVNSVKVKVNSECEVIGIDE